MVPLHKGCKHNDVFSYRLMEEMSNKHFLYWIKKLRKKNTKGKMLQSTHNSTTIKVTSSENIPTEFK